MFNYRERDDVVIIDLDYDLVENIAITFKSDMKTLIDQGKLHFILNMENVSMMTSMGRSAIFQVNKKLIPANGWIRLSNINPALMTFIRITSLGDSFPIYDSVEDALSDR